MNQNYGVPNQHGQHPGYMQQQMYQQQQAQMGQVHQQQQQGYYMPDQQSAHQQQTGYGVQPQTPQMVMHNITQPSPSYQQQPQHMGQQGMMSQGGYQQQPHQPQTPQMQQPQSQLNMPQPSPQQYQQQHSVGSFHNPSSIPTQPHTPQQQPQQQISVQQRSVDGRFTSPASVPQRSPFQQTQSQHLQQPPSVQMQQHTHQSSQPQQMVQQQSGQQHIQQSPQLQQPGMQQQRLQPGHPQMQHSVQFHTNSTPQHQPPPAAPVFPSNPFEANKILVTKELRRALTEISLRAEQLLAPKFVEQNGQTDSNQSADTPRSAPGSVGPAHSSPDKTKCTIVTEDELRAAKERFVHAITVFLNVADDIERNFTIVLEAEKECSRYDQYLKTYPGQPQFVDQVNPLLETQEDERRILEKAIDDVNDIVQKVRAAELKSKTT